MSYRYMRVVVMFDLPTGTKKDRRNYSLFRKNLIKSGFYMMQESIYSKLALNSTVASTIKQNVIRFKPPSGLVQLLILTEKQFNDIEFIVGSKKSDVIDSTDRYIEL